MFKKAVLPNSRRASHRGAFVVNVINPIRARIFRRGGSISLVVLNSGIERRSGFGSKSVEISCYFDKVAFDIINAGDAWPEPGNQVFPCTFLVRLNVIITAIAIDIYYGA